MKKYKLIAEVLFKSGIEITYHSLIEEEISEKEIINYIGTLKQSVEESYRDNNKKASLKIDDTYINSQDTSAITFSYEEIE